MSCTKIVLLIFLVNCATTKGNDCPTAPIQGKINRTFEIIGYHLYGYASQSAYDNLDYNKLTTIVLDTVDFDGGAKNMACYAHKKNVKVLLRIRPFVDDLLSYLGRWRFVNEQMQKLVRNNLDGFDVAYLSSATPRISYGLKELIILLSWRLNGRAHGTDYVLSMSYVYCVRCIPGRTFDYNSIKDYVDYFYVMMRDKQWGERKGSLCKAESQDRYNEVEFYMNDWIKHFPKRQIVFEFPWYGYFQQCVEYNNITKECYVQCSELNNIAYQMCSSEFYHRMFFARSPHFRGIVPMSDYIETPWDVIGGAFVTTWNNVTKSNRATFKNRDNNKYYQFNFEDEWDLNWRYELAKNKTLRGIGIWHLSCLIKNLPPSKKEYAIYVNSKNQLMWGLLPVL